MKCYKVGQVIGNFEIVERLASTLASDGTQLGRYRVRCRVCQGVVKMAAPQIRYRRDCGCQQAVLKKRAPAHKKSLCWMSDGEIYRSWKEMRDRREGVTVLAQLNAVPLSVIEEIIEKEVARCEM